MTRIFVRRFILIELSTRVVLIVERVSELLRSYSVCILRHTFVRYQKLGGVFRNVLGKRTNVATKHGDVRWKLYRFEILHETGCYCFQHRYYFNWKTFKPDVSICDNIRIEGMIQEQWVKKKVKHGPLYSVHDEIEFKSLSNVCSHRYYFISAESSGKILRHNFRATQRKKTFHVPAAAIYATFRSCSWEIRFARNPPL